jgi:hypothetical protein
MIINMLINLVLLIFGALFSFLPKVTLASLPYVGSYISSSLIFIVGLWNGVLTTFPYAVVGWHVFLWIILPFEGLMLVAKFFLGHRVPAHLN